MTRYWLAGAAAFALMTGVALAQGMSSETTRSTISTTSTAVPITESYSSSSTQHVDRNGNAVDESRTYQSESGGSTTSTNSQTTAPDGSVQNSYHEEKSVTPDGGSTISRKTTTTTDR